MLFLTGCILWTKKDRFEHLLRNDPAAKNALVEFGPLPMIPDVQMMPDLSRTEELLLQDQQELIEQQLKLKDNLLKELKEKQTG